MPVGVVHRVTGEVDLPHRIRGQRVEIGDRIEPEVVRGHEDVVDVAEQSASGEAHQRREELGLRDRRVAKAQIARRILDQDPASERILRASDVLRDDRERLLRVRQREQVVQIGAARDAPGQMLGDQARLDAIGQRPEPCEVSRVERPVAAEREPDAVERDGVVPPHRLELRDGGPAAHVVLRVHLDPRQRRPRREDLRDVRRPQPDPARRRHGRGGVRVLGRGAEPPSRRHHARGCGLPLTSRSQAPAGT